jgi:hypothetical protein
LKPFTPLLAPLTALAILACSVAAADDQSAWDGSRTVPVHRLPIFDENAQVVVPTLPDSMPLSARYTCGACHDYDTVAGGFHFNGSDPAARSGRPGEPWVWVDRATGAALPISERNWPGVWSIQEIGISPWRFTQIFGRHLPGGDLAEPADPYADPAARWLVSGAAEVNCFACHNQSPRQDLSEWAKQMMRENFRWAATAAANLGDVGSEANRLPDYWTPARGANPDDPVWAVPPSVDYHVDLFDSAGRTFFDVDRPLDRNCLQCHSSMVLDTPRWRHAEDVHTAAGLACVDCHRNGLDHDIVRGYESEASERNDPTVARFSCAGCHLGVGGDAPLSSRGGHYAAPRPQHKGLPPIHFEKLTCTACHSGALLESEPQPVRTSRANRLGIHGRAEWFTDAPHIVETAYVMGASGKIEPHRLMWPSFWVRVRDGEATPLTPDFVAPFATGILDAPYQARQALLLVSQWAGLLGEPLLGVDGVFYKIDPNDHLLVADVATTASFTGIRWAQAVDGRAEPLLPDFDAAAEYLDAPFNDDFFLDEVLIELCRVLLEWRPYDGEPVLIYKGKLLWRNFDGLLERADAPDAFPNTDQIVLAWRRGDDPPEPLVSDFVARAIRRTVGADRSFTEAQVARVLHRMIASEPGVTFGYVHGGMLFRAGESNSLVATDDLIARPVSWPLGHDVRPTEQSLGARGCTDCHAADAPFYFADVTGSGPMRTIAVAELPMHELQQVDAGFQKLFGRSFEVRQAFKFVGLVASALLAALLLVFALGGLGRLARWAGRGKDA